jgi:hypothetical protein
MLLGGVHFSIDVNGGVPFVIVSNFSFIPSSKDLGNNLTTLNHYEIFVLLGSLRKASK